MEEAIKKSEVLIEALPYIKKFFKKNIVIKFGGSSLGDAKVRRTVLEDIVFMNFAGMNPVLVHGGGPFINDKMKALGKTYTFVKGLRVTDEETMTIVDQALEELNHTLVTEIKAVGAEAFGLSGKENELLVAQKKMQGNHDIGYVGNVAALDTTVLDRLLETNIIPVISPVGMGRDGKLYNINADEAAARIAVAIKAEKIIVLTNVDGVLFEKNEKMRLLESLSLDDIKFLIEKGIVTGGMIPKVQACIEALEGKVKKAHIISARLPHAMLLEIFTDKGIGTEIVKLGRRTKATEGI
ncbi:MAG: acetylglutamate kinase [Candidatus Omnitrophica bacterium]|nr:acetylglutamate kinase [Candidatus Omnitrophota bacterium]